MDDTLRHQLERATTSLRTWLEPLTFTDLSRTVVTQTITAEVVAWARAHRFEANTEVQAVAAAAKRRLHGRRLGLLDVAATHPSGQSIAVEIDFANKVWSIEKLAAEADNGRLAIWIKWGTPAALALIPEKVGVIELAASWANRAGHLMYSRRAAQELATATAAVA